MKPPNDETPDLADGGFGDADKTADSRHNTTRRAEAAQCLAVDITEHPKKGAFPPRAQVWREATPPHLIALIELHQHSRPFDPLPASVQREIARSWGRA